MVCPSTFRWGVYIHTEFLSLDANEPCPSCAGSNANFQPYETIHRTDPCHIRYNLVCVPSHNGGLPVRLHPQSATLFVFSILNATG